MSKTYLGDGSDDGTVLGRAASDKIAFHNATPAVQAATIATIANDASGTAIATAVNAIITALIAKGLIAAS